MIAVDALVEWAESGSPEAVVSNVKVAVITDVKDFKGFKIRR